MEPALRGPTLKALLVIQPGERAAANADLENVDHVAPDRKSRVRPANMIDRFHRIAATLDHRAFCGGTAHVERDEIIDAEQMTVARGTDAAADRAGFYKRDRLTAAPFRRNDSAMRPHQQQGAGEAALPQLRVEFRDVLADLRSDIGIRGRCRGALKLVPLAREFGSGGDEDAGNNRRISTAVACSWSGIR
jgi:hypothetical protein